MVSLYNKIMSSKAFPGGTNGKHKSGSVLISQIIGPWWYIIIFIVLSKLDLWLHFRDGILNAFANWTKLGLQLLVVAVILFSQSAGADVCRYTEGVPCKESLRRPRF